MTASFSTRFGRSSKRSSGAPIRTSRTEKQRASREQGQRHGRDRREGERGQRDGYVPSRRFLSSAEIAGTTSCRSPITA